MAFTNTGAYVLVPGASTATPGATIASATWNSIHSDLGTSLSYLCGAVVCIVRGVTFSTSTTDNQIQVVLPTGFTRFRTQILEVSNPTVALNTATVALFTGAGGTGLQIVTSTAITITTTVGNTNNNAQSMTPGLVNTIAVSASTVYFRIMAAQPTAGAQADVFFLVQPVS